LGDQAAIVRDAGRGVVLPLADNVAVQDGGADHEPRMTREPGEGLVVWSV
jgi:hypothetical protein